MLLLLGLYFVLAVLCALLGLAIVATDDLPLIAGSVALIVTFAALGVALLH